MLSLGANLPSSMGSPASTLSTALASLGSALSAQSSLYATSPVGGPEQPDFVNCCALVTLPDSSPSDFLSLAQSLETAAARERAERWGPRTLDVDVITVRSASGADVVSADPSLTLPHPRAHERLFVLVPWAEVEPDANLVGHGPIASLIANLALADPSQCVRVVA